MDHITRQACGYVLLHPSDCIAPHGLDLTPGSRDSIKVDWLTDAFREDGFNPSEPALAGYPCEGKIQLVKGTHRHEAATRAGILLPVTIILRSVVEAAWGTAKWNDLMEDIPVKNLELIPVPAVTPAAALGDRIDLVRDME